MVERPFIVGLGGTIRENSSTELALKHCLSAAEALGADTVIFLAKDLDLPMYGHGGSARGEAATRLVHALRQADGVILASPGYHGSISGLLKNALDYVEDLRADEAAYLDGRAVGCITSAYGAQAIGTTIVAMRTIIHALRGWPTPMAAGINSADKIFDAEGRCIDGNVRSQIEIVANQVFDFATMRRAHLGRRHREPVSAVA
ncbi:NADPH-dependent FMN reductase [Chelatococcus reniformis]|uniref:FMN reductase n=1 Tax=Chelatococcus reniformis TaxID=1494448 RepID=A0A916XIG8_9HYPH|nr:NAD(P)H-dependent oxidoreductase [Chelatococcus reniformis]GGC72872.1 FMN reductase [Chelatococcus reniformis]